MKSIVRNKNDMRSMSIVLHIQRKMLIQVCIQWLRNIPKRTTGKEKAKKAWKSTKKKKKRDCDELRGWNWIEKLQDNETLSLSFKIKHVHDVVRCGSVRFQTDGSILFPPWLHCSRGVWRERWMTTMQRFLRDPLELEIKCGQVYFILKKKLYLMGQYLNCAIWASMWMEV